MSEIRPGRINLKERTKLETAIPLTTPFLIFIDPSNICNASCKWCPTGRGDAKKYSKSKLMDYMLFKTIINDMKEFPDPVKVLRLYKDGEPLFNVNLPKMIRYAKDSGKFLQVDTTTNGTLLTPKEGKKLVDAGLDAIFISVPQDYSQEYVDQIRNFWLHRGDCDVHVKIIGDGLSILKRGFFYQDFDDISDSMFVENLSPCWGEFEVGKVGEKGIYGQELSDPPKVCPYIFYSTAINSDGLVSLCFLDWKHKMIIGDMSKESFKEVWDGKALQAYRLAHLKGNRDRLDFCKDCKQLIYGAPDNIDKYANKILERIDDGRST
jgi:MoaA/NifB/PqqE/SkfB family radical SAM enzyme